MPPVFCWIFFFFIETKADTENTLDRTATKLFFRVVITADYAFSSAMGKNYSFHGFDFCAGPPGICFFMHTAVATAEKQNITHRLTVFIFTVLAP